MLQNGSQDIGVIIQVIKVKRNEMGGACGTYDRHEKCLQGFDGRDLREIDHLELLGVDGMIILKRIFKTWDGV
jgi:hypothetical protein